MADKNLVKLVQIIDIASMQNSIGQSVVWEYTDLPGSYNQKMKAGVSVLVDYTEDILSKLNLLLPNRISKKDFDIVEKKIVSKYIVYGEGGDSISIEDGKKELRKLKMPTPQKHQDIVIKTFSLSKYIIYGAACLICILTTIIIILIVKRRKKEEETVA